MGRKSTVSYKMKLVLALVTLQLCFSGFHIVSRVALNIGVSKVVYPVYRNIIALLLLSPFAYFLEKKERPPLTFSLLVQFFLLALLGITANQGFYILGLYYASPTLASAMQNSVPAITFLAASALRLEQINIARKDGLAKVLGTIVSVGGATVITLYKGPILLHQSNNMQNWTLGCIYLLGHCLSWAGWLVFQVIVIYTIHLCMHDIYIYTYIGLNHFLRPELGNYSHMRPEQLFSHWSYNVGTIVKFRPQSGNNCQVQAPVLKKYPAKLTLTSFTCFFGLIQFLVIAAFVETDFNNWKIQSMEELFTILYAGIVASGIVFSLQTWCIHKVGPVFVAIFQPLQMLLVAIMAFVILGDKLYSGCVFGAVLIVVGLYLVLWGKTEEKKIGNIAIDEDTLKQHLLIDPEIGDHIQDERNKS
ncbi:hypothetical protein Goklo_023851 [Gossypium klotzschianum]|uniref:EamA domain-containing protein n=2 Tax=Gossypium TaxID=3633 RepID=A0A7J8W715_9ROSI|nr:hypothetical protein [Gossypium klotzschianum]